MSYDLRGHGGSPAPSGPYTIDDFVDDHEALMALLDLRNVDLVGYSLGGLVAEAVALRSPESVRRLVVIAAVAGRTAEDRQRVQSRLAEVECHGPTELARRSVDRWFSPEYQAANPGIATRTIDNMARLDRNAYTAAYRVLATTDLADRLGELPHPVLAIAGEHDIGSPPRMAQLVADSVPNGRCVVVAGMKHALLDEAPERIAKEVSQFVQ